MRKAHADDLHAVGFEGHHLVVFDLRLAGDAKHHGDVGAVDVGVQHANLGAFQRQADGQVGADGALAHAALAAGNGHDVLDRDVELAGNAAVAAHLRVEAHLHVLHAGHQRLDRCGALVFHLAAQRAGRRRQHDGEADAVAADRHIADHIERDQIVVQFRFLHGTQCNHHRFLGDAVLLLLLSDM